MPGLTLEQKKYIDKVARRNNRVTNAVFGFMFSVLIVFGAVSISLLNGVQENSTVIEDIVSREDCENDREERYLVEIGDLIEAEANLGGASESDFEQFVHARDAVRELLNEDSPCDPENIES